MPHGSRLPSPSRRPHLRVPGPVRELAGELVRLFLPAQCLLCDKLVDPSRETLLCPTCASGWREVVPSCPVCGRPQDDLEPEAHPAPSRDVSRADPEPRCARCRESPSDFDRARSVYIYEDKVAEAIRALKYHRRRALADLLGQAMAERLPELFPDTAYTAVVPVPLHWTRFWARGFNQAELLAWPVARALGAPLWEPVYRARATRKQARLGKADRQDNLEHAFAVRTRAIPNLRGATLLVIDDVFTTGATTSACAAVLKEAGADRVDVLTVARTP